MNNICHNLKASRRGLAALVQGVRNAAGVGFIHAWLTGRDPIVGLRPSPLFAYASRTGSMPVSRSATPRGCVERTTPVATGMPGTGLETLRMQGIGAFLGRAQASRLAIAGKRA